MSAHIRFVCPTCKTESEAPVSRAGEKTNCRGCGQRLQIPATTFAKTILAPSVGIRHDDAGVPTATAYAADPSTAPTSSSAHPPVARNPFDFSEPSEANTGEPDPLARRRRMSDKKRDWPDPEKAADWMEQFYVCMTWKVLRGALIFGAVIAVGAVGFIVAMGALMVLFNYLRL